MHWLFNFVSHSTNTHSHKMYILLIQLNSIKFSFVQFHAQTNVHTQRGTHTHLDMIRLNDDSDTNRNWSERVQIHGKPKPRRLNSSRLDSIQFYSIRFISAWCSPAQRHLARPGTVRPGQSLHMPSLIFLLVNAIYTRIYIETEIETALHIPIVTECFQHR